MSRFLSLCLALAFLSGPAMADRIVMVGAGQSNAAKTDGTPAPNTQHRVFVWNANRGEFRTVGGGVGGRYSLTQRTAGHVADALGCDVYVIETAVKGSSVGEWLDLLAAQAAATVSDALAAIDEVSVDAVLWHQGEADAISTNYLRRQTDVFNRFRASGVAQTATPILVFDLASDAHEGSLPDQDKEQLRLPGADPFQLWIPAPHDWSTPDGVHWDHVTRENAARIAAAQLANAWNMTIPGGLRTCRD